MITNIGVGLVVGLFSLNKTLKVDHALISPPYVCGLRYQANINIFGHEKNRMVVDIHTKFSIILVNITNI